MDNEVATSECKENKVATSSAKEIRSQHQSEVATSIVKKGGRDIIQRSRHHEQKREVAKSFNGRDVSCTQKRVATTPSCRDINCEDLRSRHHQAVATTGARKRGHDIIQLSRHPLQRPEGRDNI